jgi:stress response protein YsnF
MPSQRKSRDSVERPFDTELDLPVSGARVRGADGVRATVDNPAVVEGKVALIVEGGTRVLLDAATACLSRADDGSYEARVAFGSLLDSSSDRASEVVIPVVEQIAALNAREVETGRVRVSTRVEQYEQAIEASLWVEEVAIERVPIHRVLGPTDHPKVREVGNTLVIPVLEETLVLEKKLVLREEVRLTRTRKEVRREEQVPLRREYAVVEHLPPSDPMARNASEANQLTGSQHGLPPNQNGD